jgi:hypothetical protein
LNLQGFEYIRKIEKLIRLSLGRIRARPSCTATRGPCPQWRHGPFAQCTRPTALPGRPWPARPATAWRCTRAHTGAVTALRARIAARPAAALPWRRGNKVRCSSIHGGEATRRASGWRRRRSPMKWGLRWPAGSCIGVGRKRKLRCKCTCRKRRQGGARGSAHRGGVHDDRGDRTTVVVHSDRGTTLEQRRGRLRTRETAWSGRARARRGEGGISGHWLVGMAFNPHAHVRTAPPTAANQGAVRGDTATDRWAPHVSVFLN